MTMTDNETLKRSLAALNFGEDEPPRNVWLEISAALGLGGFDRTAPLHGLEAHGLQAWDRSSDEDVPAGLIEVDPRRFFERDTLAFVASSEAGRAWWDEAAQEHAWIALRIAERAVAWEWSPERIERVAAIARQGDGFEGGQITDLLKDLLAAIGLEDDRAARGDEDELPPDSCAPCDWMSIPYDPSTGAAARALATIKARQGVEADPAFPAPCR